MGLSVLGFPMVLKLQVRFLCLESSFDSWHTFSLMDIQLGEYTDYEDQWISLRSESNACKETYYHCFSQKFMVVMGKCIAFVMGSLMFMIADCKYFLSVKNKKLFVLVLIFGVFKHSVAVSN